MRRLNDICKGIRNALAIYGGLCILTGVTVDQLEKNWDRIMDKTEERIGMIFGYKTKEPPIEVEYKEVV